MRLRRSEVAIGLLLLLAVGIGCRRSPLPGAEAEAFIRSKADTSALGELLVEDVGRFAYRMPAGWKAVRIPGNRYQVAVEPEHEGYRANIQVSRESIPRKFELFVQESRASLLRSKPGAMIRDEAAFTTEAGVQGRRWNVTIIQDAERLSQTYYLIPGANDDKLVITVSATPDQELRLSFIADLCLKTLVVR